MKFLKTLTEKPYITRDSLFFAIGTTLFFLSCISSKIVADFTSGQWQSLTTRIVLVSGACSIVAVLLRHFLARLLPRSFFRCGLVFLFLAILIYPAVTQLDFFRKSVQDVSRHILQDQQSSGHRLTNFVKQFPGTYELYVKQHFTLPKFFVHLDALIKIYILGVSPNSNVAVGKNGYFFEGWGARKVEKGVVENFDNIADYMGQIPFSDAELRKWKRTLEERRYWLKEKGSNYVFVLAPTKAFVYPEFLPDKLQNIKGRTRYEQLSGYLKKFTDLPFIDVLPPLLAAKKEREYPDLFYKTDFHWNFYGAYIVYDAIVKELKGFFPQYSFPLPAYTDFSLKIDKHWAHHRFMDMIGLPVFMHKNEHYITFVPEKGGLYDAAVDIPPGGIYDVYPPKRKIIAADGSSMDIRMILNPQAPIRSLALLGDSFLEKCVYFFSANAQRVLNYRTVVNFPQKIFFYEQPDIVIQEILNMFILRPPPENPPGFKESYLRGKFADCADNTLVHYEFTQEQQALLHDTQGLTLKFNELSAPVLGEVRTARIRFNEIAKDARLHLKLLGENGAIVGQWEHRFEVTASDYYFELPPEEGTEMVFTVSSGGLDSVWISDVEVHSDRHLGRR